jgi:hypothetical protein
MIGREEEMDGEGESDRGPQPLEQFVSTQFEAKPTTNDWAKPCALFHLLL